MREVKIFLGTIERVKDFVNAVTRLDCDMDIVSGRYVIDAKSMEKYLIDWKDGLAGSGNWGYSYAIRAEQTVQVLDTILTRIGYMLKKNSGVQTDGKT